MKKFIAFLITWSLIGIIGIVTAGGILLGWWKLDSLIATNAGHILLASVTWLLTGGVGAAFWQIIDARKSTNAQIAVELFRELRSPEVLETLRFIYSLKTEENAQNLTLVNKHSIDYVLDRLGMLGALVANGIIDKKLAIEAFGGVTVLKCWYQLKKYIEEVRKHRGSQWGAYAEDFANRAFEHWKGRKNLEWVLFYRFDRSEECKPAVKLLEELQKDAFRPRSLKEQIEKVQQK